MYLKGDEVTDQLQSAFKSSGVKRSEGDFAKFYWGDPAGGCRGLGRTPTLVVKIT